MQHQDRSQDGWFTARPDVHFGSDLAAISHDFRNLVQCALSASRVVLVALEQTGQEPLATHCRDGMAAMERATDLAHQLSTQISSSAVAEEICLGSLIGNLAGVLRLAAGDRIKLSIQLPSPLPPLYCDYRSLENMLVNLVINSRQAIAGRGWITISAEVATVGQQSFVTMLVRDTGPGIPPALQESVFRRAFTTKLTGSGIGLATARTFVEAHGGTICLENAPMLGARARISLPAFRHVVSA